MKVSATILRNGEVAVHCQAPNTSITLSFRDWDEADTFANDLMAAVDAVQPDEGPETPLVMPKSQPAEAV